MDDVQVYSSAFHKMSTPMNSTFGSSDRRKVDGKVDAAIAESQGFARVWKEHMALETPYEKLRLGYNTYLTEENEDCLLKALMGHSRDVGHTIWDYRVFLESKQRRLLTVEARLRRLQSMVLKAMVDENTSSEEQKVLESIYVEGATHFEELSARIAEVNEDLERIVDRPVDEETDYSKKGVTPLPYLCRWDPAKMSFSG